MKAQKPLFNHISTLKNLPTLPHILLKLFDACNQDGVDLNEIASIVSKDPALSAKLLKLVNSAYFGMAQKIQEINQAVVLVGTSGIRNMALCACVHDAFPKAKKNGHFNLKAFWWHSLKCAFLSRHIAAAMNFEQTDDAFVIGLLHDIGKVVLWINFSSAYEDILKNYPEGGPPRLDAEARLGATHGEVAAWLLERWHFQSVVCDAVRYHHCEPEQIAQAFPMTQIVYVANQLCQGDDGIRQGLGLAQNLLGLSPETCDPLIQRSIEEAQDVAAALDIKIDADTPVQKAVDDDHQQAQDRLDRDVRDLSLLMGTLEGFMSASERNEILTVISNGLNILLDVDRLLFFLVDSQKDVLSGYTRDHTGRYTKIRGLAVSLSMGKSLLVKAIVDQSPLVSFGEGATPPSTILDEQIIRLTRRQGIYCLPLVVHGDSVGVLVLGLRESDLPHLSKHQKLLNIFLHKGALALRLEHLKRSQLNEIQAKRADASGDLARRVVHEVNNPLGIIKNYLKILEMKLSGEDTVQDELNIINDEISRVSRLLKKLTDFSAEKVTSTELTDINALLMEIVKLTKESLLRHSQIRLQTDFQTDLPTVRVEKAGLKQVFINLIKNAAEAMQTGGNLLLKTRYLPPPIGKAHRQGNKATRGCVEIQVMDDGPGIEDHIKEKLFDPYVSSKADGHSGLGLSIAYNIVKSFQGQLTCESRPGKGTSFKIELPRKVAGNR